MAWGSRAFTILLLLLCASTILTSTTTAMSMPMARTAPPTHHRPKGELHTTAASAEESDFPHALMGDELTLPWLRPWEPLGHINARAEPSDLHQEALPAPEPRPPTPGPDDWIVTGEEVRRDETIILTGNLIIQSGGNLTLINCTLLMNCSSDGEWQIRVERGGMMNVLEGSNITAYDPEHEFLFYVYGSLIMHDSFLSECGYWDYSGSDHLGLWLETSEGVELYNTTITRCCYGVYCYYRSSNIIIRGCTISNNDLGLYCFDRSSNITISNCTISNNEWGLRCAGSSIIIRGCTISNNDKDGVFCESSSNIAIIDCMISHNGENGIECSLSSDITISNCTIRDNSLLGLYGLYYGGVLCYHSSNITITGCTITSNDRYGLCCDDHSSNITISNCTISGNGRPSGYGFNYGGIYCCSSSDITISGCTISDNDWLGVYCLRSVRIAIEDCTFIGDGVFLCGDELAHYASHIIESNTVNGKPLYYVANITGYTVPPDAGQIILANAASITVCGANLSYADVGLEMAFTNNTEVENCMASFGVLGLYCYKSSSITIRSCSINNNSYVGVIVECSVNFTIEDNVLSCDGVFLYGDELAHYASHIIENNTVNNRPLYYIVNTTGYTVPSGAGQVIIINSSNIMISGANLSHADVGLEVVYSEGVEISYCTIDHENFVSVYGHNVSSITMIDCTTSYNDWLGMIYYNSSDITISGCTISDNEEFGVGFIGASSNITIVDCAVSHNGWFGVICLGSYNNITISNIIISDCTISDNGWLGRPGWYGYQLYGGVSCSCSSNITVSGCTMNNNDQYGVACADSSSITIRGCTMNNNSLLGLLCVYSSDIIISNCVINNNDQYGVACADSSSITIRGCTIIHNGYGIYCYHVNMDIHYCNIYSNEKHGLYYCYGRYLINASYCWWGSPDGPEYKEEGDPYDPEEVYGFLIYEPWLTEPWVPEDVEPPTVEIYKPEDGSYVRGVITIRAEASDDVDVDRVEFYINGSLVYTDYDAPYKYEWNTTGWADGTYVINATAYDTSNNTNYDTIIITVDNTPPQGQILAPVDNSYVHGIVQVNVIGEDANLHEIRLYIDGALVATWNASGTYSYEWNTAEWPDGSHTIRLVASDLAGNAREIAINVVVDNTAPVVESVSHAPEEPVEDEEVVVEANITDATSGVVKALLWYRVDGGTWVSVEMTYSNGVWKAAIPGQEAGSKVEYYVEAYDRAGNTAKSDILSYEVRAREVAAAPAPMPWTTIAIIGGVAAVAIITAAIYVLRRRA